MTKRAVILGSSSEKPDFLLRWGNKKRLRCTKTQQQEYSNKDKIAVNTISRAEKKLNPYRSTGYDTRNLDALGTVNGKGGGSSLSRSGEAAVWPKFVVVLSNWEKEEDFLIFKRSKIPQRPKKRAKCIHKILNQISPGMWLADVSVDRYEVREKKTSMKVQKLRSWKATESNYNRPK